MRGSEEGPERPAGRRASGRLVVALVVAGAAVVVLATAISGPASVDSPFGGSGAGLSPVTPPPAPTAGVPQPQVSVAAPVVSAVVQTVLEALVAVIALVVAVLLIRLLVRSLRRRTRTGRRRLAGIEAETAPEVADAPTVLRGIAAALAALDEHREPADAVVRAWLGLQQAAEDAGLTRSPAETPTEFTGRVLSRTGTDRTALRTLLRLYLRARFDDAVIAPGDAAAARDALLALEASWGRVPA